MTGVGIHDIAIATGHHVLELDDLAERLGVDPAKYHVGIGQDAFSVPAPDEDIVTMGAAAAKELIDRHGVEGIRTVLFATESGVDQSKAAGVYVHGLLGLPKAVRVVELKQACYGGMAAVQLALGIVARAPHERVLVIAADVARYDVDTPAEPTQGAGAAAILVSADPDLIEIEPAAGVYTADVDDFWRPNDRSTALVDGRLSVSAYVNAFVGAWDDLAEQGGPAYDDIARFVHHQPFTKMAIKAHRKLTQHVGAPFDEADLAIGFTYNRQTGNTYTASLWIGLAALLDLDDDLAGERLGLFSYGSGSVGELITGTVRPDYREHRRAGRVRSLLEARVPLTVDAYRALHAAGAATSEDVERPRVTTAPFRFAGVRGGARHYEASAQPE
ncbi:hydroxymethylglutaryl-CoA synthase [Curtobacterium sp. MCLR17_043]|uniref:hydroxymethylglutaryl-CoA synthase n=2 Tax=Curtobacterium TaxID=2034 RepID=UPI000D9092F0|nr:MULTISPECIES: hydroxymethylglutaryl-CoA synthase [Curtobacterium]MBT1673217.1 hydroxymethylglutaryl-CoA synthase [Curtobacterium flaccumfaciens pv. flaccumfaciens]MCS6552157.1 hydroxymethylglutaryl-CoA synthase [Curtobacterium flaccumfaciens pv. flaccumfaciens]PYY46331.1 hydroxymethylglutaryl-CoA synthase [Curtobacterium sp. MCLR17_043]PZF43552.1 hydroxymethylglutaryl-CoA synthase [Curtobacterium sp. MCLR17_053]PZF54683.1 hydroxymethylglutaryl-CoA synthase [Curtobacterium sp. MCLR17_051]